MRTKPACTDISYEKQTSKYLDVQLHKQNVLSRECGEILWFQRGQPVHGKLIVSRTSSLHHKTSIEMIRNTLSHAKEPQVRLYTDKTAWNYISSLKCCRKRYHTKKKRITPNMNTKEILFHIGQSQNIPITLNIDKPMRKDSTLKKRPQNCSRRKVTTFCLE